MNQRRRLARARNQTNKMLKARYNEMLRTPGIFGNYGVGLKQRVNAKATPAIASTQSAPQGKFRPSRIATKFSR